MARPVVNGPGIREHLSRHTPQAVRRSVSESPPHPPIELVRRVGVVDEADPVGSYELFGRRARSELEASLPGTWSWEGKTVLEFGCGAGRVLRTFLPNPSADLHGCDIDRASVEWLADNLSPPLSVFVNQAIPPLDRPDETFDLVYAVSVFTHITDEWAAWLRELHRVLRPGGVLAASFLGSGTTEQLIGEPWNDAHFGMNVLATYQSWDEGGPLVFHSPWWLRAHWGRIFDICQIRDPGTPGTHGWVICRKREGAAPSEEELRIAEPGEPRELSSVVHNLQQTQAELSSNLHYFRAANAALRDRLAAVEGSKSWRATEPLRKIAQRFRASQRAYDR
jgi:SAM-dependent methyltransferase